MKVWVTQGYFDERGDGRIVELNAVDGTQREVLRFQPPGELSVPAKGLTGACWIDDDDGARKLLVCGAAAVYRFEGESLTLSGTLALPSFNDLHGVHATEDRIYVVNTGMDSIDVFTLDGTFVGAYSFEAAWLAAHRQSGHVPSRQQWQGLHRIGWSNGDYRFNNEKQGRDYYHSCSDVPYCRRQQRDFVHPNHVCVVDGAILVTSLQQRAVIDVGSWRSVMSFDSSPHDGQLHDARFYVTRIDGFVESRALNSPAEDSRTIDVTKVSGVSGWCRGLCVSDDLIWVGFTQIRRPPRSDWGRRGYADTSTSVVALERVSGKLVAQFDLGESARHSKVFTILEAA